MLESVYHIPGAPRLALVADLHNTPGGEALAALRRREPELILVAGDVIYGCRPTDGRSLLDTQANVLPFLRACAGIAPCFVSLGNHELLLDEADLRALAETGATVLDNAFTRWRGCVIGGLSSGYAMDYRRHVASLPPEERAAERYPPCPGLEGLSGVQAAARLKPDTAWLDAFTQAGGWHILLCHHPEYWPLLRGRPIELVCSGHAHGGQVRLFGQGLFSPGQGILPRYTRGLYEGRLLVSAGLANTVRVPRLFNPPELVFAEP